MRARRADRRHAHYLTRNQAVASLISSEIYAANRYRLASRCDVRNISATGATFDVSSPILQGHAKLRD